MFFDKKQKAVEAQIECYLVRVDICVQCFHRCMESALSGADAEVIAKQAHETQLAESQADDMRREIALMMYGKALFPESRGDILGLLEALDKVPNRAEAVALQLQRQRMMIPPEFRTEFGVLLERVVACVAELLRAVRTLFTDYHRAMHLSDRVDDLESRVDETEFSLIEKVFLSERDLAEKILLRDLIQSIGGMADRAENTADRVRIIAVKRTI